MLSTFLSALPSSLALLWTSYGPPGNFSELSKIVEYTSILPLTESLREFQENGSNGGGIGISMDGKCFIGLRRVGCEDQLVGRFVNKTIPLLLSYQIYYSLLTYTLFLGIFYHFMIYKNWSNKLDLIKLRRFTLIVMVIKDFIGVFGVVITSLALLLLPLIDPTTKHIIDVKLGWGMIISIFVVFGSGLLTRGYEHWSRELLKEQVENGIILNDESINNLEAVNVSENIILIDEKVDVEVEQSQNVENEDECEGENGNRRSVKGLFDLL